MIKRETVSDRLCVGDLLVRPGYVSQDLASPIEIVSVDDTHITLSWSDSSGSVLRRYERAVILRWLQEFRWMTAEPDYL